jgi:hypothetical protein
MSYVSKSQQHCAVSRRLKSQLTIAFPLVYASAKHCSILISVQVRTGEKEPPQILEPLKSLTVEEGETVVLSTRVVGNPTPTVTWFKNGKPVTDRPTHREGDTYSLTLLEPTPEDTAQYAVQAKNSVGFAETTATVVVEGNQLICATVASIHTVNYIFIP